VRRQSERPIHFFNGLFSRKPCMAVKHIVLLKFTDATGQTVVEALAQAFGALPSLIPGIVSFEAGENISPEGLSHGFTHAFEMTFVDLAARDAYLPHEQHQAFVQRLKPCLADVLVVDYVFPTPSILQEPSV
jgi:hypothetical protein